ncbi:hypothetical protein FRC19_008992 [Serendipita sp. 401]|nr:hypothetical protein FRC19_008992 [Serendipita sp. 401]KAG9020357.1 hypothetical protein FS842_007378 [Serendipita sp. 407]
MVSLSSVPRDSFTRASETKKRSQFISEEKATYLEKIGALEGRIATLTTERQDAAEEISKIQESHQSLQQQFDAVDAEKQDVLGRLTAAERREEQLRKDSEVLSERGQTYNNRAPGGGSYHQPSRHS